MSFLGIDVGGTKVALRLEGGGGVSEATFAWPSPAGSADDDLEALRRGVKEVVSGELRAVGVAMPATVGADGRVTAWPNRPQWIDLKLGELLRDMFPGVAVAWADDGDLAGLAEAHAAGLSDIVYFGLGTGVGGAVVLGSRNLPVNGSVELGHMVVQRGGPSCDCGRSGCLQALASGPATLRRASRLRETTVSYAQLCAGWGAGEAWAVEAVTETCDAVAAAAVSLNEVMHPSAVVIGGGFAAGLPGLVEAVAGRLERWSRPGHPPPPVRAAALGGLSSLHGAVLLARMQSQ